MANVYYANIRLAIRVIRVVIRLFNAETGRLKKHIKLNKVASLTYILAAVGYGA